MSIIIDEMERSYIDEWFVDIGGEQINIAELLEHVEDIPDFLTCNEFAFQIAYESNLDILVNALAEECRAVQESGDIILDEDAGSNLKQNFKKVSNGLKIKTAQFFKTVTKKLEDMDDSDFIKKYGDVNTSVSKNEVGEAFIDDFETIMFDINSIEDVVAWYRKLTQLIIKSGSADKIQNLNDDILSRLKKLTTISSGDPNKNYNINTKSAISELKSYDKYYKEVKSLYALSLRTIDSILKTVQAVPDKDVSKAIVLGNKIQSQIPIIDTQCIKVLNKRRIFLKKAILAGYKKESNAS